jgi:hypothetical protein
MKWIDPWCLDPAVELFAHRRSFRFYDWILETNVYVNGNAMRPAFGGKRMA